MQDHEIFHSIWIQLREKPTISGGFFHGTTRRNLPKQVTEWRWGGNLQNPYLQGIWGIYVQITL
jgi:hypothetical protein